MITEEISTIKDKKYLFKTIEEELLSHNYKVHSFYTQNRGFKLIPKKNIDKLNKQDNLYCLLAGSWQTKTRITEYYKLKESIEKKENKSFDFYKESQLENNKEILYYGIIKVSEQNFHDLLNIISKYDGGILFSWGEMSKKFDELVLTIIKYIAYEDDISIAKSKIVNSIIKYNKHCIIINPYIWYCEDKYVCDVLFL
jgi:hypothetical protein